MSAVSFNPDLDVGTCWTTEDQWNKSMTFNGKIIMTYEPMTWLEFSQCVATKGGDTHVECTPEVHNDFVDERPCAEAPSITLPIAKAPAEKPSITDVVLASYDPTIAPSGVEASGNASSGSTPKGGSSGGGFGGGFSTGGGGSGSVTDTTVIINPPVDSPIDLPNVPLPATGLLLLVAVLILAGSRRTEKE